MRLITVETSKRQGAFGPDPRRNPPSSSAWARTQAGRTPKTAANWFALTTAIAAPAVKLATGRRGRSGKGRKQAVGSRTWLSSIELRPFRSFQGRPPGHNARKHGAAVALPCPRDERRVWSEDRSWFGFGRPRSPSWRASRAAKLGLAYPPVNQAVYFSNTAADTFRESASALELRRFSKARRRGGDRAHGSALANLGVRLFRNRAWPDKSACGEARLGPSCISGSLPPVAFMASPGDPPGLPAQHPRVPGPNRRRGLLSSLPLRVAVARRFRLSALRRRVGRRTTEAAALGVPRLRSPDLGDRGDGDARDPYSLAGVVLGPPPSWRPTTRGSRPFSCRDSSASVATRPPG